MKENSVSIIAHANMFTLIEQVIQITNTNNSPNINS